ncbi:hypothetical protein D3C86_1797300 [compost metagenome]
MPGGPADRSLLSRIVQGSKSFKPRRRLLRITGSSVTDSPLGRLITVVFLISRLIEPTRTLSPAILKMR